MGIFLCRQHVKQCIVQSFVLCYSKARRSMHSFFRLRSKMSICLSMVALASLIGGFAFLGGLGASTPTALAKGFTYSSLTQMQKRLLSGFLSSEIDASQTITHPNVSA